MGKQHTLIAKGLSLSFLTLCSRILGLVREMTKAKFLGTSALGDAFGIAFQVPNFCRRLFAENSISVAFIPTFKNYLEDSSAEGKQRTQEFIRATFTLVSFLTAVFVALGMMFTPLIFIKNVYAWTLLGMSIILLARWEITFYIHPERFAESTNDYLKCANCTEKLCTHKKQLHGLWMKTKDFTAERVRKLKK